MSTYYDLDSFGSRLGLPGTGIIGLMLGDQLHPPMVDDADMWADGSLWHLGAAECARRLATLAGIRSEDAVVDVGCGIGGPARLIARERGCTVTGLNPSLLQLSTSNRLTRELGLQARVRFTGGRMEALPFANGRFTCAVSINMFYHVADKTRALGETHRVLRPGGRLALDDWVATEKATNDDLRELSVHWSSPPWITDEELLAGLAGSGFTTAELRDYSTVGSGVMARYFDDVFQRDFTPRLRELDPEWGEQMSTDFRAAVNHSIELYRERKIRYLQLVATRS